MILLNPEKITLFIVNVLNTRDNECLADVTKALNTDKTITHWIQAGNCVMGIHDAEKFRIRYSVYIYYTKIITYIYIQINLNGFVNNILPL